MINDSVAPALLRVATWNTEWAPPNSKRGLVLRDRLAAFRPDIVCLTECHAAFLQDWGGDAVISGPDWGYDREDCWREVLLWSRTPWREKSRAERSALPPGRFVNAATETRFGEVSVAGLVIPYHFAHVRAGRRDRRPWEEHCLFLDGIGPVLDKIARPRIALGDFNQRIPSTWVRRDARNKLRDAFADLKIVTAGSVELDGNRAIDHIACDRVFRPVDVGTLSNVAADGWRVSDHFGVTVTLADQERLG